MNSIKLVTKQKGHYIYEFKTSDSHRLLLNLSEKINVKRSGKCAALLNFSIY